LSHFLELDGKKIPVALKWHARAKRLILKLNPKEDGIIVTLPKGIKAKAGLEMAEKHRVWIANQFSKQTDRIPFEDGATIQLRGTAHTLNHRPDARGVVWSDGTDIFVTGKEDFFQRRLTDWLKKQAKSDITAQAHDMAATLGKQVNRISVKDTVSRWGSCSHNGNLSFNWRLILAPSEILTYVVAHEVSHLKHMDHSAAFWETVDQFDVDAKKSRLWLKKHGSMLQRNGR